MIDWDLDERSTRNCLHCKVKGQMAVCHYGVNAFYKNVIKLNKFMSKCTKCTNFESFEVKDVT
jgi:hypothetical protein